MNKIDKWRQRLAYATLIQMLILLELILSVVLLAFGHLMNDAYFRGVGVGLVISWVTSALAYLIVRRAKASLNPATKDGRVSEGE